MHRLLPRNKRQHQPGSASLLRASFELCYVLPYSQCVRDCQCSLWKLVWKDGKKCDWRNNLKIQKRLTKTGKASCATLLGPLFSLSYKHYYKKPYKEICPLFQKRLNTIKNSKKKLLIKFKTKQLSMDCCTLLCSPKQYTNKCKERNVLP